jgi:hypothetical protein
VVSIGFAGHSGRMNGDITRRGSIYENKPTTLSTGAGKLRTQRPHARGGSEESPWTPDDDKKLREAVWRGEQGSQLRRAITGRTLKEIRKRAKELRLPPIPTQPTGAKVLLEKEKLQRGRGR